jgi:hypothetical protein
MRNLLKRLIVCFAIFLPFITYAQDGDSSRLDRALFFPDKMFGLFSKKAAQAQEGLDRKTDHYLSKLQRREEKLRRKLYKKDSLAAKALFPDVAGEYQKLKSSTGTVGKYAATYSGHLDSLTTSLKFLQNGNLATNPELKKTLDQYAALQSKLNASEQIKKQLQKREQLLKEQFQKLGMVKELKSYQKQLYYYRAQIAQYKEAFEDPSKLEAKLLEVLSKIPQFKDFFRSNSMLGSLFALPGGSGATSVASLAGLQTRSMVSQALTDRFGSSSAVTDQLRGNLQAAQGQLSALKNKFSSLSQGSYGNAGDGDLPSFKPNGQKTKPFLQRLEWGANIQSQKARYFFPVTSDIGLSLGYKINDGASIGLGASYKIGWGRNWSNISITHQGIGLRSYVEYKIKGAFFLSGGYEMNYRSAFKTIDQLKDYSAWQRSGLIGLSKKYSVSKKLKGDMKLLWDFLSYQQTPRTQAILFRIGYHLK